MSHASDNVSKGSQSDQESTFVRPDSEPSEAEYISVSGSSVESNAGPVSPSLRLPLQESTFVRQDSEPLEAEYISVHGSSVGSNAGPVSSSLRLPLQESTFVRQDSEPLEAEYISVHGSSVESNAGPVSPSLRFSLLASIDENRSFHTHTAQESAPLSLKRGASREIGGPATKKARTNSEATSAGRPVKGTRGNTAAPSSEATKARKTTTRHITTASSTKAAVAPLAEASLSKYTATIPEASSSTDIITSSSPEPSRRGTKRSADTMTGGVAKKARTSNEATFTGKRGATMPKASAKRKALAARKSAVKGPIGKGKERAIEEEDTEEEDTDKENASPPPNKGKERAIEEEDTEEEDTDKENVSPPPKKGKERAIEEEDTEEEDTDKENVPPPPNKGKERAIEEEDTEEEDTDKENVPPPPKKGRKGKKRAIEEEDSDIEYFPHPPKKGRKGKKRAIEEEDTEEEDTDKENVPPPPKKGRKGKKRAIEEEDTDIEYFPHPPKKGQKGKKRAIEDEGSDKENVPPPPKKGRKGKKRAIEDEGSDKENVPPPPKKGRKGKKGAIEDEGSDKENVPPPPKKGRKGKKRAIEYDDSDKENIPPPPKKARVIKGAPAPKPKVVINEAPTQRLDVFVCGEGSSGELGLGVARHSIDVKRPRYNPFLSARDVGVVHVATGGMHAAAITHDNLIYTWGVNDQGALGRDTTWDGGMRDVDDSDDEEQETNGLNPRECTPTPIPRESFPPDVVFVQLACGDSNTFALTDDGDVYGWGTFRGNDGILGFSKEVKIQATPVKLPSLKKIKQIACGANHSLALQENGDVFIWGSGEQSQLGHRIIERKRYDALTPRLLRLKKKCQLIGCGLDHSFVVERNQKVWTWGLNSFGEAGIREGAGGDNAVVSVPTNVPNLALQGDSIASITGGAHHSVATTANGELLIWGRVDGNQMGLDIASLPNADLIRDASNNARILIRPTRMPAGTIGTAQMAAVGTDHTLCINTNGNAFSWGFNVNYQCGQGNTDEITRPTRIENTAVRERYLNWAGAGGQFSVLTSVAEEL